ncbi:hypothetical protein SUGI_1130010 [Cryptomeria japonica]|nr:hypothetical protein SUGI_1130010 [Cryptomeria japonica]
MGGRWISHQEIVKATDGFNNENLLGTASFSSVYKGIMSDGKAAVFKLLNLESEEAVKSFFKEYKVLVEVRHMNLVKIISLCLEFGHKIVVLEFMSKGNLETLLHFNSNSLTFIEKLNISLDVIHGLEYLHNDSFVQLVHCDIKPSNILMNEDMTAHLADFGIAQIICGSQGTSTITLKGSIGYIAPEYGLDAKVSTRGDIYNWKESNQPYVCGRIEPPEMGKHAF